MKLCDVKCELDFDVGVPTRCIVNSQLKFWRDLCPETLREWSMINVTLWNDAN